MRKSSVPSLYIELSTGARMIAFGSFHFDNQLSSLHSVKPEISLPFSQQTTTCPCRDQGEYNLRLAIISLRSILILFQ